MIIFNFLAWEGKSWWGEGVKEEVYRKDQGEGGSKLDQAMNGATQEQEFMDGLGWEGGLVVGGWLKRVSRLQYDYITQSAR